MITLIAALGKNRELGEKNHLLWDLPADMKHFRERTKNAAVIMGRKTFESIGFPLPKRKNIIITRNPNYKKERIFCAKSVDEAIEIAEKQYSLSEKEKSETFIIGGAQIYSLFLPKATHLSLTFIDAEFPNADAFFPEIDFDEWEEISRIHHKKDSTHEYGFDIVEYKRKTKRCSDNARGKNKGE